LASTSVSTRGGPQFGDGDAPDVAGNASEVARFAETVGTRRVGTTAERNLPVSPERFVGLQWGDTTDKEEYRYTAAGWAVIAGLAHVGTVTLSSGVTSEFASLTRTGNIVSLFISNAQRTAAWTNAVEVANIPIGFRPAFGAPITTLNGATGTGRSGSVTSSGGLLAFGETGSGSAGRLSFNGSWPVA